MRISGFSLLALMLWVLLFSSNAVAKLEESDAYASVENSALQKTLSALPKAKRKQLPDIIGALESQGGASMLPLFRAMLEGKLFYSKSRSRLVVLNHKENGLLLVSDVINGEIFPPQEKSMLKKIKVNNKLRKQLRNTIGRLNLFSDDVDLREQSAKALLNDLNEESIALLKKAKRFESSPQVIEYIDLALLLANMDNKDPAVRLGAVKAISGSLQPVVKNRLRQFLQKGDNGEYREADVAVRLAAEKALKVIESKNRIFNGLETLFFGLSLGSVLLLAAIGLSITFGVMGVINMAHGELLMLGAYSTYVIQQLMPNHIGVSLLVAIPVAFLVSGFVGILIERGVIQFLKGRPLETLLATFGVSLILQQAVRSVFSPLNRQVTTPQWMSGAWEINPVLAITYNRLYIVVFSLIVFTVLLLIMKRTALGLYVRAVSQNREMARAMGIRSERIDALTFGLGSGIAGVAGVALSQLTNVGPNLGQAYIIDSFMVVVFGGVGNLWGTLVGGFSLGIVNKFLEPATGAVLAKIIVLVFIVLFIQKRPSGLFPQRGRSAE